MAKIVVKGAEITVLKKDNNDFICLTDMVKGLDGEQHIKNWLRTKSTVEFLGVWESLNNPDFNMVEFDHIKGQAGSNTFLLSVNQWIKRVNGIGLIAKSGRYGGTYAHKDIAFEFGTWISAEFKLLLIKEFQRLKDQEAKSRNFEWDYRRFLSKVNYKIHTDAIKNNIILPNRPKLTAELESYVYANEAEILNLALFGITSKQWRENNPELAGQGLNIRDVANILQLTILANLETLSSHLIAESIPPKERLEKLQQSAITQLGSLSQISFNYSVESPHFIGKSKIEN